MADRNLEEGTKPSSRTRRRANNRKRQRENSKHKKSKLQQNSVLYFGICVLLSIVTAILLGNLFIKFERQDGFIANFIKNYREHFHQIVHGKPTYCVDKLDSAALTAVIRQEQSILHQNKALLELQLAMETNSRRILLAIAGPVGVGKTLYVNALQKHFPWPENVYSYTWNAWNRQNLEKYQNINALIENFSDCGVNLLIIRNLTPADKQLIDEIIKMYEGQLKTKKTRSIIIFVFNLNAMLDDVEYSAQYNSLQNLRETETIYFRSFGRKELEDCIRRESKLENVTLSDSTTRELLEIIDVKRSGCKNVNAKVLAFGKKIVKQETNHFDEMFLVD